MDIEREILDLKKRVGDLEGAVNVLTGNVSQLHPDLEALRGANQTRFDTLDHTLQRVCSHLEMVNTQVWSLRDDLPVLFNEARKSRAKRGGNA